MQKTMQDYFGVYRNEKLMSQELKVKEIEERTKSLHLRDKSNQFSERVEALEYLNMLGIAKATAYAA